MNTKTSILMAKARRPLGCGVRKFGILLTVMAAAIIALPNTVTNDVVVATSDAELRISDRGLGLGLEVVGGGAAEVKLETRPGWRFRDGSTSVTLNKAAGSSAKSPSAVGEGQSAEGSAQVVIEDGEDDEDGDDEGSVDHVKPILSLTASAPKVVAYSVHDGGTNVSISLSATVTTKGKHRKLDAEGNVVEEKEFSPKRYVWKMTGVATGEAETDSATHTFTINLTKGESKSLNFSVVGKTCSICDGEVESDKATDSVEIDVYELSISRPDYLGLDRTDAGRQGHVVKTATLSSDPSLPSSSSVEWTECGICEFVGTRDQLTVSYQNKDSDTASGEYLAERLAASVKLAGMDSAFVCSTNFTVVKVDVTIAGVDEDKEETEGAFVPFVPDSANGLITVEGTNQMKKVAVTFSCAPMNLPTKEVVTIENSGPGQLYEEAGGDLVLITAMNYPACELSSHKFFLHGHEASAVMCNGVISISHLTSGAIDKAKYSDVRLCLKEVSFSGDKYHVVKRDDGSLDYVAPHWQDNSSPLDGDASDVGDRAYPICFTRDSKMRVSAKWVMVPQGLGTGFTVKGYGPAGLDFPETAATKSGGELSISDVECRSSFVNEVDFIDAMLINWHVSINLKGAKMWLDGGTSSNQTYVTLGDPLTTVFHTLVHIGCKNADGESSVGGAADSIYGEFTDRVVCRLLDGRQMTYWFNNQQGAMETDAILQRPDANGNCQAWSALLRDCFRVQGIHANRIRALPIQDGSILVKSWLFVAPAHGSGRYPYRRNLDAFDLQGVPGQGNTNPPGAFNGHWITLCNGCYYDGSYGTSKISGSGKDKLYEDTSLDGYGERLGSPCVRENDVSSGSQSELDYQIDD